jgi:hypothetical protein
LAAANGPYAIQVDYLGTANTVVHEPYRLVYAIQPPSSSAIPETEPNDSLPTASSHVSNYFSGSYASLNDSDWYATVANAGDLLFISVDSGGPRRQQPNPSFELYDSSGSFVSSLEDNLISRQPAPSAVERPPGGCGRATIFRVPTSGIYYIRLFAGSFNATGPLTICCRSQELRTGGGGVIIPGWFLQFSSASLKPGGQASTINVSRTGGRLNGLSIATSIGTAAGGASCTWC